MPRKLQVSVLQSEGADFSGAGWVMHGQFAMTENASRTAIDLRGSSQ